MIINGLRIILKKRRIFYMQNFRREMNIYRIMRQIYHIPFAIFIFFTLAQNVWGSAIEDLENEVGTFSQN